VIVIEEDFYFIFSNCVGEQSTDKNAYNQDREGNRKMNKTA